MVDISSILQVELTEQTVAADDKEKKLKVFDAQCGCPIGQNKGCGHLAGLLYTLSYYKRQKLIVIPEDVAKTSQPQLWHQPRGQYKINNTKFLLGDHSLFIG